jgi:class 3 adenylate cyclase
MQKDEKAASIWLKLFQNLMNEEVIKHNGQIVNFYGDGALCTL